MKPHSLLDWQRQAIIDAFVEGEKVASIAAEFGVNTAYPGILASRAGIVRRSAAGRPPSLLHQMATTLIQQMATSVLVA